jgi:hypothetical protein
MLRSVDARTFCNIAIISLGVIPGCSSPPPDPAPVYATPEGAALCAVATRQTEERIPAAVVNVFLPSRSNDVSVHRDLSRCLNLKFLMFQERVYGDSSPTDTALRLDLRSFGPGPDFDTLNFRVSVERCSGWPCHAVYEAIVRREPEGARVISLEPLVIG